MSTHLIQLVERLPSAKILLVGDFMLDRYLFGSAERISPEAPIPVLHYAREECRLGGAGFVLAAMTALGATVRAVGLAGVDSAADELERRLRETGAASLDLLRIPGRPTVTKTRLLGSSEDRTPHQMLRLDVEDAGPVGEAVQQQLIERSLAAMQGVDLLCLEDYNKGVLPARVCQALIQAARERNIPVLIDPARIDDYGKYRGATLLKPNRPEAERATGLPARTPEQCHAVAEKLLEMLELDAVVMTLNEKGAYLATRQGVRDLIASRPREVADGTGAGDTVLAMLAAARAAGVGYPDAVALANVAGGLEVERLGCVPVLREEIIEDLRASERHGSGKQYTLEALLPELARRRAGGRKIVFTNGCFDLIHLGHVHYFRFAKRQGDLLVVAVNTDASVRRLKGDHRPIVPEEDRLAVLEELESIDYLLRFDEDTPLELIERIRPDVLVKGADYSVEQVVGWDRVSAWGGRVALAPLVDGRSTSNVIQRILEVHRP